MTLDTSLARSALPKAEAIGSLDDALDESGRAFETSMEANNARLTADVVPEEKLARIDAVLD